MMGMYYRRLGIPGWSIIIAQMYKIEIIVLTLFVSKM